LDEPTNHLDAESVHWLEQFLKSFPGTVIAVTHDRYFLDNVAGWILELDRGEGIPWQGNYSSWLDQKSKRLENEEKQESKRQKILKRELEWSRLNPKAKQAKSKARLSAYEALSSAEAKENLSLNVPRNAVVGIIGPNGVGKTTLFRMIMGEETPDSGTVDVGKTVELAYVDQTHKDLIPEKTVYEVISGGNDLITVGNKSINARAYLSRFNFAGGDQQKKIEVLSGGERNRLHLAITMKAGGNVLLLDEPTNDIDVNTLRALEEAIEHFAGCILMISHDRWFIDRLATHILSYENDGQWVFFEGNFSAYETNKKERLGDITPKRPRFKSLL